MIGHNTLFIYTELKSLIKHLDSRWRNTDVQSNKKQKGTFQRKKRIDSTPSLSSPPFNAPKWTVDEHFLSTPSTSPNSSPPSTSPDSIAQADQPTLSHTDVSFSLTPNRSTVTATLFNEDTFDFSESESDFD